ncbi:MAG: hypothetical protein ABIC95_06965 [archaeon]
MTNLFRKIGKGIAYLTLAGALAFGTGCATSRVQYNPNPLEQRIERVEQKEPQNKREKYAVLVSGYTGPRHIENLELAYKTLRGLGFEEDKIFVLDDDDSNSDVYPLYKRTTKENVKSTLEELARKVDSNDTFLLYTTNHGGLDRISINNEANGGKREEEVSNLSMANGDDLYSTELADYLKGINPEVGILVFDQCHSGGFANRLGNGRFVGIAPNVIDEPTTGNTWPQAFWNAYLGNKGDSDSNGRVDLQEAFNFAKTNDISTTKQGECYKINGVVHKPILKTNLDASKIFLN